MTARHWKSALAGILVLASLPGLARLRFDTDVTAILPQHLPEVRGLQIMQRDFARTGELVILLQAADEDSASILPELAAGLSEHLQKNQLITTARFRPIWEENASATTETADWIAWLWLNGDPQTAADWSARFSETNAPAELAASLEAVATAPEGAAMLIRANDPFGFLRHPSVRFLESFADADGFTSQNGLAHLILAQAPPHITGYRQAGQWLDQLRAESSSWLQQNRDGATVDLHLTGEPAFASEIGRAMENDMRGTAAITLTLVAILFWWMTRRLRLLAGLVAMLSLVFTTTLGIAGWMLGELSVMTAGFAAILIGLAVDYGVLICQEAKRTPGNPTAVHRATANSILWAAATTAAVFAALNFSALPGIAALGTLVAIGILTGALIMLAWYLPFAARATAPKPHAPTPSTTPILCPRKSIAIAVVLTISSIAVILACGPPQTRFDPAMMRPRHSPAMEAFLHLQKNFPAAREPDARWIITLPPGPSATTRINQLAAKAAANPAVANARIPHGWWPDASRQSANLPIAADASQRAATLLEIAGNTGFSEEGLALSRAIFQSLANLTNREKLPVIPQSATFDMLTRSFMHLHQNGGGSLMIDLDLHQPDAPPAALNPLNDPTAHITGWDRLRPALMPLVGADVRRVFLPMLGLMLAMLFLVFRNTRDVLAITAAMALAALMVLAAMSAAGISWNILNIAAAPLFLGIGIDYGIHIMAALRRHNGNIRETWQTTGKAVVFCAASSAIGFGSLCLASNDALASFGAVSVIGITSAMLTSVLLLPGWRASHLQRRL